MLTREMKDSGIEWIGEIPKEWSVINLGKVASIQTGNTPSSSSQEVFSKIEGIEWIKTDNLLGTQGISNAKLKISPDFIKQSRVAPENSVLICCIGDIGKLGFTLNEVAYNQQINAVIFDDKFVFWKFGMYSLFVQKEQHNYYSNGNVLRILNGENQKKIKVTIPSSLIEQEKIAVKLDALSNNIDNIISKTQQSIDELKEYKQSIITEVVTKGLDKNVKMKDSGIEWIGKVPIDWEVRKIGNFFYQVKDKNIDLQEKNLLSLSYGSIIKRDINTSDGLLPANFSSYNIVRFGDIVLRMTDLQNDKTSLRTGFVTEEGIITSAYITIRTNHTNSINSKYIQLLLHSFDIYKGFYGMGSGVRQNVTFNDIKKLPIILPPKQMQDEIVNYVEKKTTIIDNLVNEKEIAIEEFEGYKKSLIYEFVTGKKEA